VLCVVAAVLSTALFACGFTARLGDDKAPTQQEEYPAPSIALGVLQEPEAELPVSPALVAHDQILAWESRVVVARVDTPFAAFVAIYPRDAVRAENLRGLVAVSAGSHTQVVVPLEPTCGARGARCALTLVLHRDNGQAGVFEFEKDLAVHGSFGELIESYPNLSVTREADVRAWLRPDPQHQRWIIERVQPANFAFTVQTLATNTLQFMSGLRYELVTRDAEHYPIAFYSQERIELSQYQGDDATLQGSTFEDNFRIDWQEVADGTAGEASVRLDVDDEFGGRIVGVRDARQESTLQMNVAVYTPQIP